MDQNKILSCDNDSIGTVTVWEKNEDLFASASAFWEGKTILSATSEFRILDCISSTDNKFFVTGYENGTAVIWDAIPFQESNYKLSHNPSLGDRGVDDSNCLFSSVNDKTGITEGINQ